MFLKRLKPIILLTKLRLSTTPEDARSALRPFYFVVHPDFLLQHPSEKEVNENSLKHLNSFIDSLQNNRRPEGPATLKFYLRRSGKDGSKDIDFQAVDITLNQQSLAATIQDILSTCNIKDLGREQEILEIALENESIVKKCSFYQKIPKIRPNSLQKRIGQVRQINLSNWINDKTSVAKSLMRGSHNVARETSQWCRLFQERLGLKAIVWDSDVSYSQQHKCCQELSGFLKHYPTEMLALKGRTLVFGLETGIHLNGDIVFGCSELKRYLWLQLLRTLPEQNKILRGIRRCEKYISNLLGGIAITHSHSKLELDLNNHLYLLKKLMTNMTEYFQEKDVAEFFIEPSEKPQLEFDSDSSEPIVLESGEVVLPLSILPKDLCNFVLENASKGVEMSAHRHSQASLEQDTQRKCLKTLRLASLKKDENLSLESMISACERLTAQQHVFKKLLEGSHVCITDYYTILDNGVMCIPWNWVDQHLT